MANTFTTTIHNVTQLETKEKVSLTIVFTKCGDHVTAEASDSKGRYYVMKNPQFSYSLDFYIALNEKWRLNDTDDIRLYEDGEYEDYHIIELTSDKWEDNSYLRECFDNSRHLLFVHNEIKLMEKELALLKQQKQKIAEQFYSELELEIDL